MALRLGKKPAKKDPRDFKLSTYLDIAKLGEAPKQVYYQHALAATGWPMYANDRLGDCTIAAAGHMIEIWTGNNGPVVVLPESDIVNAYSVLSPNDDGCDMNTVLNYWRQTGIGGHKILAYMSINVQDKNEFELSLDLFGTVYLGLALPDAVVEETTDMLTVPWYLGNNSPTGIWSPDPNNGHCVNVAAYDEAGNGIITWGKYKTMDWDFYRAYCDEAYAVLSPDWFTVAGDSPPGFNLAQLESDLQQL